ncbi:MAG: ABC transporter permease [Solirubrobacteraceae bacterium]|nr:ABC transporter permease [Solirubrobacteraceae bacterium]
MSMKSADAALRATAPARAAAPVRTLARPSLLASLAPALLGLVVPGAFLVLWWGVVAAGVFPPSVLPSPFTVAAAAFDWAFGDPQNGGYSGTLAQAIWASGQRVLLGYAIAMVLGVAIGVPTGASRLMGHLVDPFIHLLRPIPVTAWVPLSLVFFGFGFKGAVFLVALGSFFPIVVNTIEGVRGANRSLVKVGRMLGARGWRLLWYFILPASLPSVFVGLRLGMGISWELIIVAEMMSVKSGIGYTLLDAYSFGRFDVVIAAMIVLGVMGFLSDRVIVAVQSVALRWHREVSIHAEQ